MTKRSKRSTAAVLTSTPITIIQQTRRKKLCDEQQRHRKFVYLLFVTKIYYHFYLPNVFFSPCLSISERVFAHQKKCIMICMNLSTRLKVSRWNRYLRLLIPNRRETIRQPNSFELIAKSIGVCADISTLRQVKYSHIAMSICILTDSTKKIFFHTHYSEQCASNLNLVTVGLA